MRPALLVAVVIPFLAGCRASAPKPPNVLLYVVDTLRADALRCYGNARVDTPHVDALARAGTLFENAVSNASWTRPAMASLFTGLYPTRHATQGQGDMLPAGVDTLAGVLARHGYATGFLTANPNTSAFWGLGRGFADMLEFYKRVPEVVTRATEWIDQNKEPFFLAILTIEPHFPYVAAPKEFDRFGGDYRGPVDGSTWELPGAELSPEDRDRILSLYWAQVAFNDASFGRLLAHLDARGRLDDTVVVFTADHGEEFWEHGRRGHGFSLAEGVTRIPLVVAYRGSDRVGRGLRVTPTVELVDVFPTVLDLAGIAAPPALDGRSLLAAADDTNAAVFASLAANDQDLRALWLPPWKLVWNLRTGDYSLYDLASPAGEGASVDTATNPAAAREGERLRERMSAIVAAPGAAPKTAPLDETLPDTVKARLRELGYID